MKVERLWVALFQTKTSMEALRFIERPHNGQLTIHLPEELNDAEVEVIVRPLHEKKPEPTEPSTLEILEQFRARIRKDSPINLDELNPYEQ